METIRTAGYYWVMPGRDWEPGFWTDDHWLLVGDTDTYQDDDFDFIGPHLALPNQSDLFRLEKPSLINVDTDTDLEESVDALVGTAQQRMEAHHDIKPNDDDWGLFCYGDGAPGIGGGVGAFYWFHSREEMLSFIAQVLPFNPPGPAYDNPRLKQQQVGVIADAIRIKAIGPEQGLQQLNKALSHYSQIEWWGTFHDLIAGKSPFAQHIINAFEDSYKATLTPPLSYEQRQVWLNFLSEYGV